MGKLKNAHLNREPVQPEKLMISGPIAIKIGGECVPVEVRRGMIILTRDGVEAGQVAAVAFAQDGDQGAYILQCCLPETPEYRMVVPDLIEWVGEASVRLSLTAADVEKLPRWRSSEKGF